jgi:3-phosphoshikimate 1-carboxyvinyltransferase
MQYPNQIEIIPLTKPPHATIRVPGSKSITNRALVLAALTASRGDVSCKLEGFLKSEDTLTMMECLERLGFQAETRWSESWVRIHADSTGRTIPWDAAELFVANSGTTMRFLTAVAALGNGRYRLDGVPRMRERPIGDLLHALNQLGVRAISEFGNDCPPVVIESNGLPGGTIRV